jgi:hypothetical protein
MLPQDVDDFIAHGADMILGKPLKISVLSATVKEHFNDSIKLSDKSPDQGRSKTIYEHGSPERLRKYGYSDAIETSRRNSDVNCGLSRRNSDVIEASRRNSDISRRGSEIIAALSRRNSEIANEKSRRGSGIIDTASATRRNSDVIMESSRRNSSISAGKSCSDSDESGTKLPSIKI